MKKIIGTIVLCGSLLASTGAAFAQQYGPGPDHGRPQYHGMHDQGSHEGWYKKGGRLPQSYRGRQYVVSDWRGAHLRPPPRGYHWVHSDNGDFLLVAVTTGVIASIIAAAASGN
jgi:Ni/Co efflux regulator RcnB